MTADLSELTEAIYDAALAPQGWAAVMRGMHELFRTTAETFYLLDPTVARMRSVHIEGISSRWLADFEAAYFSRDNPWVGLSEKLHQPGVVRTNERLHAYTRDDGLLYRSQYYNEWMRPQQFRYTIGNTLLREPTLIANVTLLRPPDMPTFDAGEVRLFERLSRHLTRAVRLGLQFEQLGGPSQRTAQAIGLLPQAVMLLDPAARLLYANPAAEDLLRRDSGLVLRDGRIMAARGGEQGGLQALLRGCEPQASGSHTPAPAEADTMTVHPRADDSSRAGRALTLSAMPLPEGRSAYRHGQRAVLLLAVPASELQAAPETLMRSLYGFTPAEARLARALADGIGLRAAADYAGVAYGTARGTIKILFHKTGTHRQADLVRCLLRQVAPALKTAE